MQFSQKITRDSENIKSVVTIVLDDKVYTETFEIRSELSELCSPKVRRVEELMFGARQVLDLTNQDELEDEIRNTIYAWLDEPTGLEKLEGPSTSDFVTTRAMLIHVLGLEADASANTIMGKLAVGQIMRSDDEKLSQDDAGPSFC